MILSDAVLISIVGGCTTVISGLLALVVAKINAVQKATDGINSALRRDNAALSGEVNRLSPNADGSTPSPTPQTRADAGAQVTRDAATGAVHVAPEVPPKP